MAVVHSARISPLLPPTEWTLADGELTERRGARMRRFPLQDLRRLSVTDGLARADFAGGRVRIPARSFGRAGRLEDHSESFARLAEALAVPPSIRVGWRSQPRPSGVSIRPITTPTTRAAVNPLMPARKTAPVENRVSYSLTTPPCAMPVPCQAKRQRQQKMYKEQQKNTMLCRRL